MAFLGLWGPPDIGRLKSKKDTKSLCAALRHIDASVRYDAALALRELGWAPPTKCDELVLNMAAKNYDYIRDHLSGAAAVAQIIELMSTGPLAANAKAALWAIGTKSIAGIIQSLLANGRQHPGEDIGVRSVLAMSVVQGKQTMSLSGGILRRPSTNAARDIRWALVSLLKRFGLPAVEALTKEWDVATDKLSRGNIEWAMAEMGRDVAKTLVPKLTNASGAIDGTVAAVLCYVFDANGDTLGKKIGADYPELITVLRRQRLYESW